MSWKDESRNWVLPFEETKTIYTHHLHQEIWQPCLYLFLTQDTLLHSSSIHSWAHVCWPPMLPEENLQHWITSARHDGWAGTSPGREYPAFGLVQTQMWRKEELQTWKLCWKKLKFIFNLGKFQERNKTCKYNGEMIGLICKVIYQDRGTRSSDLQARRGVWVGLLLNFSHLGIL